MSSQNESLAFLQAQMNDGVLGSGGAETVIPFLANESKREAVLLHDAAPLLA
jgi:hypothetical protein